MGECGGAAEYQVCWESDFCQDIGEGLYVADLLGCHAGGVDVRVLHFDRFFQYFVVDVADPCGGSFWRCDQVGCRNNKLCCYLPLPSLPSPLPASRLR